MSKIQRVCLDEIVSYFNDLEDPRSSVNLQHPLVSVVVIAMMAVLAGAGGPTAIATWALSKEEFLLKILSLPGSPYSSTTAAHACGTQQAEMTSISFAKIGTMVAAMIAC